MIATSDFPRLIPAVWRASVVALAVCAAVPGSARAEAGDLFAAAAAEVSGDLAACSAYFAIVAEGISISTEADGAGAGYEQARARALEYSLVLAEAAGDRPENVLDGFNGAARDMSAEISSDFGNLGVLVDRHGDACNALLDDAENRLAELLAGTMEDDSR